MLSHEILALAREFGLDHLGFLTLTFADLVLVLKEANRRFDSLNSHVIKARYRRGIVVPERQKSRRLHFHLVVVLDADIRSGCDFEAFERGDYRSANAALRAEWAFWRVTCPRYRFGRHELLPIKSCAEGIARYVGGYVGKHVRERSEGDKGARLVRYIGYRTPDGKASYRKGSTRLAWNTDNAWLWRHKLAAWAKANGASDTDDLVKIFGRRWAWHLQAEIMAERLDEVHPSPWIAGKSHDLSMRKAVALVVARDHREGKQFGKTYEIGERKTFVPRPCVRQHHAPPGLGLKAPVEPDLSLWKPSPP